MMIRSWGMMNGQKAPRKCLLPINKLFLRADKLHFVLVISALKLIKSSIESLFLHYSSSILLLLQHSESNTLKEPSSLKFLIKTSFSWVPNPLCNQHCPLPSGTICYAYTKNSGGQGLVCCLGNQHYKWVSLRHCKKVRNIH